MSAIPNVPESLHAQRESPPDAALAYLLQNKKATADRLERVDSKATNGFKNEAVPQWSVHDSPIENQRPIKVIVIGAGYSGIYLGIRLPERHLCLLPLRRTAILTTHQARESLPGSSM
jgi:hypothetical protein